MKSSKGRLYQILDETLPLHIGVQSKEGGCLILNRSDCFSVRLDGFVIISEHLTKEGKPFRFNNHLNNLTKGKIFSIPELHAEHFDLRNPRSISKLIKHVNTYKACPWCKERPKMRGGCCTQCLVTEFFYKISLLALFFVGLILTAINLYFGLIISPILYVCIMEKDFICGKLAKKTGKRYLYEQKDANEAFSIEP